MSVMSMEPATRTVRTLEPAEAAKRLILFVDDDINILQALGRMLRSERGQWDMDFASSGADALRRLEERPFDLIITDMRMPGMDGSQLLNQVRERHPSVMRIVLSGQAEVELNVRVAGSAHQYLSKPCDAEMIKNTMQRAHALASLFDDKTMIEHASRLESIPSIPQLRGRLRCELATMNPRPAEIANIVEQDLGMSLLVLKLVNSAFFGTPRRKADPRQAVSMMDLDVLKSLVECPGLYANFKGERIRSFSLEKLTRRALQAARAAATIAAIEGLDQQGRLEARIGGLFSEVGRIVLAISIPEEYETVLTKAQAENRSLAELEQQLLGVDQAKLGAYLLGLWGFSWSVVMAIAGQAGPSVADQATFGPATAVHAALALIPEANGSLDLDHVAALGRRDRVDVWQSILQEE